jgi:hypothetical protein
MTHPHPSPAPSAGRKPTHAELSAQVRLLAAFVFDLKPGGLRRALAFLTDPALVQRLELTPMQTERRELVEAIRHMTGAGGVLVRRAP